MAFKMERFDILKQNYDKTGLFFYHDTVGTANDGDGNTLAQITATDFFNDVVNELAAVGALIFISATDGAGLYRVTQLYDSNGEVEVKVATSDSTTPIDGTITNAKLATDVKVGSLATLTTTAKASVVAAINELATKTAANQAASTAADVEGLKTDFNTLLTKLKNAKLMAADA